ncbi:hypothetical protein HUU61_17765 [Rhodopseudomonas palustris]|nr:hypothetical protein [Rhodopseudomonas palustris]
MTLLPANPGQEQLAVHFRRAVHLSEAATNSRLMLCDPLTAVGGGLDIEDGRKTPRLLTWYRWEESLPTKKSFHSQVSTVSLKTNVINIDHRFDGRSA